jgi:hypothetical protein
MKKLVEKLSFFVVLLAGCASVPNEPANRTTTLPPDPEVAADLAKRGLTLLHGQDAMMPTSTVGRGAQTCAVFDLKIERDGSVSGVTMTNANPARSDMQLLGGAILDWVFEPLPQAKWARVPVTQTDSPSIPPPKCPIPKTSSRYYEGAGTPVPVSDAIEMVHYPLTEAINDNQGCVSLSFKVNQAGKPFNIEVVDSFPDKDFVAATRYSLEKSSFTPTDKTMYSHTEFRLPGKDQSQLQPCKLPFAVPTEKAGT